MRALLAVTDFLLGHPYAPAEFLVGLAVVLFVASFHWGGVER